MTNSLPPAGEPGWDMPDWATEHLPPHEFEDPIPQAFADVYRLLGQEVVKNAAVVYEADHDSLTGLLNRKGFGKLVESQRPEIERGGNYAMVAIDLDGFKEINDRFGHAMGDRTLEAVGQGLRRNVRYAPHPDLLAIARAGGDEIWLLLDLNPPLPSDRPHDPERRHGVPPESDLPIQLTEEEKVERSLAIVERLRSTLLDHVYGEIPELRLSGFGISMGIAIARPGLTLDELLERADSMAALDKLRQAPEIGRVRHLLLKAAIGLLHLAGVSPRNAEKISNSRRAKREIEGQPLM